MRLNEMINTLWNQNSASVKTSETTVQTVASHISTQIKALVPGQILQGEVLEHSGDVVRLLVNMNGESVPLQARLEAGVMLSLGKSLLFQVKNNGTSLSLSPLFENMGMEQNAAKALETASLPVNEETMAMTAKLMKEGISIDKNTLQEIYHEVISFQDGELMDIIDLHKLNLPVTRENLLQMHSYKGMTHQLSGGIEQLSQDLQQFICDMVAGGREQDVAPFLRAVLTLDGEMFDSQVQSTLQGQKTVLTEGQVMVETFSEPLQQEYLSVAGEGKLPSDIASLNQTVQSESMPAGEELPRGMAVITPTASEDAAETAVSESMKQAMIAAKEKTPQQLLTELFHGLKQAGVEKEALTRLVNSDAFKANIQEFLQKQLLLEPESVDKEQIKDLYLKLEKQLTMMSEALTQVGREQSQLGNSVQNLNQNLQFLNQLNHMYAYVQLPLKLSEGNAHGELYVYSNKRHLAASEGEVSALLHLDMEHLGPLDVHVILKESQVSTRFLLQDDAMLDFLNEHMDLLTARLAKRGYQMTYSMKVRGEQKEGEGNQNTTLQELLDENSNIPMMAHYSFDVRA